ncbi:DUF1045 domain-containing protein [Sinorhizobium arboris]|uniref:DUF1045 domain-containing protein n=1 Tax=Sinorhizobium arboris TaxID=76745 RepID=UPI0003FADA26|nr:DUF1045 domain-containing protein [Sinorhizobium arboris]
MDRPNADVPLRAEPRRYGFHATLKAPFRLAPRTSCEELRSAIQSYVQSRPPCPIALQVTKLGRFFALAPLETTLYLSRKSGRPSRSI